MSEHAPAWTCDFCALWNRVTKTDGITKPPCPYAPDLVDSTQPACLEFVNRFDTDPISREE